MERKRSVTVRRGILNVPHLSHELSSRNPSRRKTFRCFNPRQSKTCARVFIFSPSLGVFESDSTRVMHA